MVAGAIIPFGWSTAFVDGLVDILFATVLVA
jgi:hypothetical protein